MGSHGYSPRTIDNRRGQLTAAEAETVLAMPDVGVAGRAGDPHALTDHGSLPPADGYDPGPGPLVTADDTGPARVRFVAVLDIAGACLAAPDLRAGIVEALSRFNTTRIAVSAGEPLAGRVNQ